MKNSNEKPHEVIFGSLNRGAGRFQMKEEDLWDLSNTSSREIGTIKKRLGYEQKGSNLTSTSSTSTSSSTTTTSTSTT